MYRGGIYKKKKSPIVFGEHFNFIFMPLHMHAVSLFSIMMVEGSAGGLDSENTETVKTTDATLRQRHAADQSESHCENLVTPTTEHLTLSYVSLTLSLQSSILSVCKPDGSWEPLKYTTMLLLCSLTSH